MADSTPPVKSVKAYFGALQGRFQSHKATGVEAVFQWDITGAGGGQWHAIVSGGEAQVVEGMHASPQVTITISAPNYLKVVNGELGGAMAVMTRKMKVAGQIMMARKLEGAFPVGAVPAAEAQKPKAAPKKKAAAAPKKAAAASSPASSGPIIVDGVEKPRGKPLFGAAPPEWSPKRALVTGATGFIGSNLVKVLLDEGVAVRVLVQPGAPLDNLAGLDIERVPGDLLDPASLARAVQGVDTVFHFAAIFAYWMPNPEKMYEVNVEGTVHLLKACLAAGVGRVVHCSSFATVGTTNDRTPSDETTGFNHWGNADHYVLSKYMSELEAFRFNRLGLPVVVVNPSFPFGAGDIAPTPTGVLIQRLVNGQSPVVLQGGINAVHVRDVALGAWLAALRGRPGERYILGNTNMTYMEFGVLVASIAGVKPPRFEVPLEALARIGQVNEWISKHITHKQPVLVDKGLRFAGDRFLYCSVDKARTELGYDPGSIEDAVHEAVAWFKTGPGRHAGMS